MAKHTNLLLCPSIYLQIKNGLTYDPMVAMIDGRRMQRIIVASITMESPMPIPIIFRTKIPEAKKPLHIHTYIYI